MELQMYAELVMNAVAGGATLYVMFLLFVREVGK